MELMNTKFGLSGTNGEHLLERLDLPVIRKQFLDQDTEFLRFKITLPDNLSVEVYLNSLQLKQTSRSTFVFLSWKRKATPGRKEQSIGMEWRK
jgi:hypothetical protein|tara:strand:+ start:253 stop:531 length:279 start_codon:yes stop_codon:yes gene_type:complete